MLSKFTNSNHRSRAPWATVVTLIVLVCVQWSFAANKKKAKNEKPAAPPAVDLSKLVWPPPPDIARIQYVTSVRGEEDINPTTKKRKTSWMDRLAGVSLPAEQGKLALRKPYGIAVDSKGAIYVADPGQALIFVFDLANKKVSYRGLQQVTTPAGLAIDDSDRLFVTDSTQHVVLCFKPDGSLEASFGGDKLVKPLGIAIDRENRYVYVADADLDKIFVFDADTYRLIRSFGQRSDATLAPGTFDRVSNLAVDGDSNLYVVDTFNDRIQVFDADGQFVRMFGKQGNIAGCFMRPKGIAIDGDGHVYVVDAEFNNVQVFDSDGRVLMFFGDRGDSPGRFTLASGIAIDQNNRVIVSEQWTGRIQIFHYVTDAEAKPEYEKQAAERAAREAAERKAAEEPEQQKNAGPGNSQ
jgi:DNA-binding beta-propeller fold protein YncE